MIPAHILSAAIFAWARERIEAIGRGEEFNEMTGIEKAVEAAFITAGCPTETVTREELKHVHQ